MKTRPQIILEKYLKKTGKKQVEVANEIHQTLNGFRLILAGNTKKPRKPETVRALLKIERLLGI